MNAKNLLDNFDLLADAPGGVPKLRELILQLAVRGKLVPQDPGDEPARFLVEKMLATRMKRVESGEIRDSDHLPVVSIGETPYGIPTGWEWVRIGSAINMVNGKAFKPNEWTASGIPIVRIQNLNNPDAPFNHCDFEVPSKFHIQTGDFLISWSGTPGTSFGAFIWTGGLAILNQHIFRCELYGGFLDHYLRLAVNAQLDEMISRAHGGVGLRHITKGKLEHMLITLPPLAEQKRIVARVDELMMRCDELEARQNKRNDRHTILVSSCLHALSSLPASDRRSPITDHWSLITDHFPLLFTSPKSVAELRKTILQLAVQGRLVPQDPKAWRNVKVGEVFDVVGGIQKTPARRPAHNHYPYLRVGNVQRGRLVLDRIERFELLPCELDKWRLEKGDLLVVEGNGSEDEIGRCALWNGEIEDCVHQNHIIRCRPRETGISVFTLLYLNSPQGMQQMKALSITTSGLYSLSVGKIRSVDIPLPSLAEQKRIVAKVNELMALCDALEAKLTRSRADADTLAAAIVHRLCNGRAQPKEIAL